MARTEAPAAPVAAPTGQPPAPAAPAAERPVTVLAWPSEWPTPVPPEPGRKSRRSAGRGVPVAPVLGAAGNATAMAATAAFQAGGVVGVAATGVVVAAGATAAVVKRRATVKRSMAVRAGRGAGAGGLRTSGGGSLGFGSLGTTGRSGAPRGRGSSGASTGGAGGAGRRSASGPLGSSRGAINSPAGPGSKAGPGGKERHSSGPAGTASGGRASKSLLGSGKPKAGKSAGIKAALGRAARAAVKRDGAPRKVGAAVANHTVGRKSLPYKGITALGRGVKKGSKGAWRSKARKSTGRRLKQLGGATWDGLRSLLSATWTGIRKRNRKAVLARLRDAWSRRRTDRKNKTSPTTPAVPAVAGAVRRPTTTTTSTGGTTVSGHHFVAPAMEMARIAANYTPTGMLQVGEDFAGLEEALKLNAEAMKITVENADASFPLDPRIIEVMRQIHSLQLKAADLAQDLRPAFENLHQVDLERLRNPRKGKQGEAMWDATVNL